MHHPRALPPPVSYLETRLGLPEGSLDGTDKARAENAIGDATTLVLAEVAETTAERWLTAAPNVVELVILKAARREYENPRGIYQETRGEHSVGLSESSGVYLTARELGQVRRAASTRRHGVGSLRTPSAYTTALSSSAWFA
ncbi:hypothetical protein LG299_02725 [Microbacterium lacus]|uniref:hypothetical protein n=1 Tax=Microbacterium lacus TaxID=415217 RepID=UPI00384A5C84